MNLRDLKYLVALVQHQHFGRAAESCFVSQPTLSTQIRKLEDELGVKLIERTSRQALLTDIGRIIADHAQEVLNQVKQIKLAANSHQHPNTGTFRLGIFPTLSSYLLPHVIPEIHTQFPDLELLLIEEKTELLLKNLQSGNLDACLVALPVHDKQLHTEFLFEEPFVLAVSKNHELAQKEQLNISDLKAQDLLLLEEGHCLRDQALDVCHLSGANERNGFRATSLETLRQMVASEVGITLLPILSVKPPIARVDNIHLLSFKNDITHKRKNDIPHRRIALVWRKSSVLTSFLMEMAELFQALPDTLFSVENLNDR